MFVALVRGRIKFDLAELPEKVRLQHQFGDMVDRQVNWRYFTKILNVREEMKYCRETCENNIPKPNKLSGTGRKTKHVFILSLLSKPTSYSCIILWKYISLDSHTQVMQE